MVNKSNAPNVQFEYSQHAAVSRRITKRKQLKAGRPSLFQKEPVSMTAGVRDICRHTMPKRNIRSKRLHSLQASIEKCKQNAR